MKKVLEIAGLTASGKTALSLEWAKQFNGEIINGDSQQVYKGLNIGTAKIKEEEEIIPHINCSVRNKMPDEFLELLARQQLEM